MTREGIIQKMIRDLLKSSPNNNGEYHWTQILDLERNIIIALRQECSRNNEYKMLNRLIGDSQIG